MPYLVTCPRCTAKLKSAQPVPAGRTVNCLQCKTPFTLTEPAPEVDAAPAAQPAAQPPTTEAARAPTTEMAAAPPIPPPRPAPATARSAAPGRRDSGPVPAARSRRRDDDEDDDRPPARGRRDDDGDDRPPVGRRRNTDEDDDRPRPRRRDAEDDDRPRARRGRDRDDDEDDRPRPRRGKKKGGGKVLLLALIGGGAAVLLVGGLVLAYALGAFDGLFGGGGASSDMLAWAPADSQSITVVNVDEARSLDGFNAPFAGTGDIVRYGVDAGEVSSVMFASRGGGGLFAILGAANPDVVVIKLNGAADRKRVIARVGGKEATAGTKTYYQTQLGGGLYFASDRLIVATPSAATLNTLLQKPDGQVVISDALRKAAKRADGTVSSASTGPAAETGDFLALISGQGFPFGPGPAFGPGVVPPSRARAKAVVFSVKASGDRGTVKFISTYDSADAARGVAEGAQRNLDQNRGRMNELDSYNVSQSGDTVTLTLRGPLKQARNKNLPFGGGFPF